jgi:hypothetical protein
VWSCLYSQPILTHWSTCGFDRVAVRKTSVDGLSLLSGVPSDAQDNTRMLPSQIRKSYINHSATVVTQSTLVAVQSDVML